MKSKYLFLFILLFILVGALGWLNYNQAGELQQEQQAAQEAEPTDRLLRVEITPNSTYGVLMSEAGVSGNDSQAIFTAAQDVYDLSNVRVGRFLDLYYSLESNELEQLVYQIDSEEELFVTKEERRATSDENASSTAEEIIKDVWTAERKPIDYEVKIKTAEGKIESSMYQSALDNGIDIRAIIALADAYQWTIDFAIDPRVGDSYKFIYEERYRDGQYVMPGSILAGRYQNAGQDYYVFYFEESEENKGFFDENGNSVQKMFLKAPINYKYITSGFTTGLRCLEAYNLCTNHRAIDYAAPIGTPIRAVGDGTVVFAGWNSGGYGYLTTVRHNGTYTTNYAHQSQILVKYGQKVKQGEIIGKVGSTGLSTGPHLHYEMVKYGVKINPLTEVLPPGEAIKEENKTRFFEAIKGYQEDLK
jgi:murein DD-endopeptidase MepM/ murein hydrolase activator NlpD